MTAPRRVLSIFNLTMINIIAIDSIRSLPTVSFYGLSLVTYYLLAGALFFFPVALVSAELATGWPKTGGLYIWIREAFGKQIGFIVIWLQWFYNICWYPTILVLISDTLAYVLFPHWVDHKIYLLITVNLTFWALTWLNLKGMKFSSQFSNYSAILGTLLPMMLIIAFAIIWLCTHHTAAISFHPRELLPKTKDLHPSQLTLLTAILYSLVGMEMSAAHAQEVKNPQRDYPYALFYSGIIILSSLILAGLAIAIVIPASQLNLVTGLMQAFEIFFQSIHPLFLRESLKLFIAFAIVLGALGGVGAWIISPTKGLFTASRDGILPKWFTQLNRHYVPKNILIIQAILTMILSSLFLLMPTVNSGFWLLSNITAILSLIIYLFLFIAVIILRYKYPNHPRAFKIPLGNIGLWAVAIIGFLTTLLVILIGFIPPTQIKVGSIFKYELILILGILISLIIPYIIYKIYKNK